MIKILFIKLGALGDVINTLPLAVALKDNADVTIDWLVAPLSLPLVENHKAIDRAIVFDKNNLSKSLPDVIRKIRKSKYDIILDLQRTLKSGFFTMIAKGGRKIGFDKARCKEMTGILPFERIKPNNPESHMLDQYLEFATHLGYSDISAVWDIPDFNEPTIQLPEKYIILNTGATKAANKWLPESFAELSDKLFNSKQIRCVLTGGPEDTAFSDKIFELSKSKPINLTGKTSIGELSEIIKTAIAVVSCDTGPMHLSVANNTKTIALFGPSNPYRTGPYRGIVIKKQIDCSPCNKKICADTKCMAMITPDNVLEQILKTNNCNTVQTR